MSRNASNMPIALALTEYFTDTIVAESNNGKTDAVFTSLKRYQNSIFIPLKGCPSSGDCSVRKFGV